MFTFILYLYTPEDFMIRNMEFLKCVGINYLIVTYLFVIFVRVL